VAKFTEVTAQQIKKTLARKFVPLADNLRNLLTKFGLRTYKVSIIRIRWTGGRRGVGIAEVVLVTPLLPTPKVADLSSISEVVQAVGLQEDGGSEVSEISGRYTEEELRGQNPAGDDIPRDEEVFYEIEFPRLDGQPSIKRRFFIRSAPSYNAGSLQWSVSLTKTNEDRLRTGAPE